MQSFKKSCGGGSEPAYIFEIKLDNKEWGSPSSFFSYKSFKLKLRVFLAGHIAAMVSYCATKLTATCSSMIGQYFDTMNLTINRYRIVIMINQNLLLGKCWKPFWATSQSEYYNYALYWAHIWLATILIPWNKRNYLLKNRIQFPIDQSKRLAC